MIYIYTLIREPSIYSRWFLTQRTTTTGKNGENKLEYSALNGGYLPYAFLPYALLQRLREGQKEYKTEVDDYQ